MADRSPFPFSGPVDYVPAGWAPEPASPARIAAESALGRISGVQGMGEGRDAIGNPAWIAYVTDGAVAASLPRELEGRAVVPEITGEIRSLPA